MNKRSDRDRFIDLMSGGLTALDGRPVTEGDLCEWGLGISSVAIDANERGTYQVKVHFPELVTARKYVDCNEHGWLRYELHGCPVKAATYVLNEIRSLIVVLDAAESEAGNATDLIFNFAD